MEMILLNNLIPIFFYNIVSRAVQSNLVYVSVLKISIVLAESASKSPRQIFFFARAAIVSAGKNTIFLDNNGYKQRPGAHH